MAPCRVNVVSPVVSPAPGRTEQISCTLGNRSRSRSGLRPRRIRAAATRIGRADRRTQISHSGVPSR